MLDFEREAMEENVLFHRIQPGEQVRLGSYALLAGYDGHYWHCCVDRGGPEHQEDRYERWYAVNYRYMRQQMGFADLITYTVDAIPGHFFRLGFHADMTVCVSHVRGLSRFMADRDRMTLLQAFSVLREPMERAASLAVQETAGSQPTWDQLCGLSGAIREQTEGRFFRLLYDNGLCLMPHSLMIKGFATPRLDKISVS